MLNGIALEITQVLEVHTYIYMVHNSKGTLGELSLPFTCIHQSHSSPPQRHPEYFSPLSSQRHQLPNGAFDSVVLRVLAFDGKPYSTMSLPFSSRFPLYHISPCIAIYLWGCEHFTIIIIKIRAKA